MNNQLDLTNEIPENYIAALDIGSNSFHFVYARLQNDNLQVLYKEKYQVKLAQGLDANDQLDKTAINRGVNALKKLSSTVQHLTSDNFRVVATYTLRQAKNADQFITEAAKVFPFDIEVISGHEEARLIYQGVAYYSEPHQQRLVIDIGGGSTECVIGKKFTVKTLASLPIGCISFQQRFFAQGEINQANFERAIWAAKLEIESILKRFSKIGWQTVIGTSGSIKTIYNIINANFSDHEQALTLTQLHQLKSALISYQHVDNIALKKFKESRKNTLCPGLAIIIALVEMLKIDELDYCDYALREGVLAEQLNTHGYQNVQERTINSLAQRFTIDLEQANHVEQFSFSLYKQLCNDWHISSKRYKSLLKWSVLLHEIGLDINPSSYHKHGQYILTHTDLAGFNQEKQIALAWLVGNHRKKIIPNDQQNWRLYRQDKLLKICILLRLSVLLTQQRQLAELPQITVSVIDEVISIALPKKWRLENPLILADLQTEKQNLAELNFELAFRDC